MYKHIRMNPTESTSAALCSFSASATPVAPPAASAPHHPSSAFCSSSENRGSSTLLSASSSSSTHRSRKGDVGGAGSHNVCGAAPAGDADAAACPASDSSSRAALSSC